MPNYTVGPGIKHGIIWLSMISMLALGFWAGWNSRGSWGLQTELAVHVADSKVMREAAEWLFNEELKVRQSLEKIDEKSIHECGRMSMHDILRTTKESN